MSKILVDATRRNILGRGNCMTQGKEARMCFFMDTRVKKLTLGDESNGDSDPAELCTDSTTAQTHLPTSCPDRTYSCLLMEFRVMRRTESVFGEGWPQ